MNVCFYLNNQTKYTRLIQKVIEKISIFNNLENFVYNEIFDLSSVIYYISIAFFFSFLTAQVFEKKRWN
ncbi:MAG: hypothetical protein KBT31_03295 [Firmicutes bacterium]|nr:hypothetical protein [Candidatus Colimorpha enterica]